MRRIRNISDEPLEVPLLNKVIQPGDVAEIPDNLDYVDFSESLFETDAEKTEATPQKTAQPKVAAGTYAAPATAIPQGVTE